MTAGVDPQGPAGLSAAASHSRFVQRLRRRYPDELARLPAGAPAREMLAAALHDIRSRHPDLADALRILRQVAMERLAVLDCEQGAPLSSVTGCVTALAEIALDAACEQAAAELDALHGAPLDPQGQRSRLWIVGMGKFGARELNVSSDIDLIYVYEHDGDTAGNTDGRNRVSNHEYFGKLVRRVHALVGETTEHGFVFRIDLALRPNGNSGPPAVSLGALEEYFQVQGREWERFAWLKSRVVAPRSGIANGSAQALRQVVMPFVFRRYLDYNVFGSLRTLHRQIRDHASKRSAGRPERANDVKLSRGGIREIEFTVQLLQVVRGGQFPELRARPTLSALQRVAAAGLMPQATAHALAAAYEFLRRVEHRIQYLDDQQTHLLATRDDDLLWIAQTMGFADCAHFLAALDAHRELVAQEFDTLLGGPETECASGQCAGPGAARASADLDDMGLWADGEEATRSNNAALAARLQTLRGHPRVLALREDARTRLSRLVQRTLQWLREDEVSEEAALRWLDWLEPLLRRESYLALLLERPSVHRRLLRLLGAARWPARYLLQHPGLIDELAGPALLEERFSAGDFERELQTRHDALRGTGEDDDESLLNLLRRAHHAEVFRTLARDVEGRLTVEQVADDLSALADAVLRITTRWCWQRLKQRHRDEPRFAIIGYGKLGGKELGYGSDLDIVFVYEDDDERAPEVYGSFVRKLINWLTVKTGEGDLFEIDTALLLVGDKGVESGDQQQRGSNTAWTWEHQAMTRARCVLGDVALAQRFDAVREGVITAPRDEPALRGEIVAMREKVRYAHPVPAGLFDVKHSQGGMVDVEFAVQFLVLSQSAPHPALIGNLGNIALLQIAERCGLLASGVGQAAADAYRELRRAQHRARLNEEPTQFDERQLAPQRAAVLALWHAVFV